MIQFIFGAKGSGKTKKMIDMVNDELEHSKGSVLFINDSDHYRVSVNNQIRFINTREFNIKNTEELYGFICGLIASNYDITSIYLDNVLRIIDANGPKSLKSLLDLLDKLEVLKNIKLVLSISAEPQNVDDFYKDEKYSSVSI